MPRAAKSAKSKSGKAVGDSENGGENFERSLEDASSFLFELDRAAIAPAPREARGDRDAAAPHYHQHRTRLRARFEAAGAGALADYELLELLLFRIIPRRDTKPLAKALIARFGGLSAVLAAPPARIAEVEGAGESVALELKVVQALLERAARTEIAERKAIGSFTQLMDYCRFAMAHAPREQFRVLFLDVKNKLIADEVLNEGTINHAPVYPREVARRALELSAAAVILVHNHPSGDPTPSRADVEITREIVEAAEAVGVKVHDHLVVGRNDVMSLKTMGLM